jgi:general secretion pathway protein L
MERPQPVPVYMQIAALLRRWIEVLAVNYLTLRDTWYAQRTLVITSENGHFVLRKAAPDGGSITGRDTSYEQKEDRPVLAILTPGEPVSEEISRAHSGVVVLELPSENVVVRRISVPVQAREFVAGIVRNQIDRLSPWYSDQALYGFETNSQTEESVTLDVSVLIASRTVIDAAREQIAATGLSVDRVVASWSNAGSVKAVVLWSRLTDVSLEYRARLHRNIAIGIAATIVACIAISIWATISASLLRGRSEDVAAQIDTLRHQLQSPVTLKSAASLPPKEREWYDKETSPTAVIVIEALSRALPDTAYLTELSLQNTTLRIVGLTNDAPPLIASLEHSGSLTAVHFFAPTTREANGNRVTFHIEGRVEPRVSLAEAKP